MDPLSQLPPECLHAIIEKLVLAGDSTSLARLLRTSKYLSSVTLPFLYSDPYNMSFHEQYRFGFNADTSGFYLTCMLLRLPAIVDTLPDLLKTALTASSSYIHYEDDPFFDLSEDDDEDDSDMDSSERYSDDSYDEDDIDPETPSSLDYLGQIRYLHFCKWQIELERIWPENGRIRGQTSFKRYIRDNVTEQTHSSFFKTDLREHYNDLLYQQALWALANPILEQLQSFHIPIYDVSRYLTVIKRLPKLEKIRFVMWELFDYPASVGTPSSPSFAQAAAAYKQQLLRSIVDFIKEHARLFPGRLRKVDLFGEKSVLADDGFWQGTPEGCQEAIQFELYDILPPLTVCGVLKNEELEQCLAHPLLANFGQVEEVIMGPPPARWLEEAQRSQELLQRCQSLKSLHMADLPAGYFKWAVKEKRHMDEAYRINSITADNTHGRQGPQEQVSHRSTFPTKRLPPLKSITIADGSLKFTDDLQDVVFSFSGTLQRLSVLATAKEPKVSPRHMVYGRGWIHLPALTALYLDAGHDRLVVDRDLFKLCPSIKTITLTDETTQYRCQDIVSCSPALLANLDKLYLSGWPALTFHPVTLHSTPQLTDLRIAMHRLPTHRHFIPPVDEMDRSFDYLDEPSSEPAPTITRPFWSWNWHLPHLQALYCT
ncbi:hypothetical protein BGW39_000708 [Mortierella sp. 14UC]|nr:hypothetical protein BGW39_000708 [Mortierella sp. 14UC]